MKNVRFVRLLDLSPDGPGVVVEVDGKEAFLPAEKAADWIVGLGYSVLGPMRVSVGVEPVLKKGTPIVGDEPPSDLRSPEARAWLANYLREHPEQREALERRGLPKGWPG